MSQNKTFALWHTDSKLSEIRERTFLKNESELVLTSKYSMISTGTERLVACGLVGPEFQEHMSVPHMEGSFKLPIKYGYSIIAENDDAKLFHALHPHESKVRVDENNLLELPQSLPAARGALISNMETVLNAIWDSNPEKGQSIAICGFGNIGSLLANTLRVHYGIEVRIMELDAWRSQKAQELGWSIATEDEEFEIIYHCTATASGLNHCLGRLKEEGKLIELSWYGSKAVAVELGRSFHYKRLQIISSQVSVIPKSMRLTHDYVTRKMMAAKMLLNESYDQLITNIIPFQKAPEFFAALRQGSLDNGLIYLIKY